MGEPPALYGGRSPLRRELPCGPRGLLRIRAPHLEPSLVTDRIWMRRLTGEGQTYTALDVVPYDDLASLRPERKSEDRRIVGFVDGLDDTRLAGSVTYRTITAPQEITQPLGPALLHVFNHQTHHRGQVHALMSGIGGRNAAPSLDLILFQRESGMGLS